VTIAPKRHKTLGLRCYACEAGAALRPVTTFMTWQESYLAFGSAGTDTKESQRRTLLSGTSRIPHRLHRAGHTAQLIPLHYPIITTL